jgi:cell division protein ZapA (FtsZ GTPase activity inhibitor)
MEIDEMDIGYITETFIPNTQRKLSELENDVMELSGNTETISDVLVTTGTVRNLITMMTQGDLSVLTERIDMIEQSATTHQHEYQNLYEQTMGFLDPNVDQLIQRVKDINTVVSGNTNDIENIKRQLSGV